MRLGEILLNAKLINEKQLSDGLSYAKSKAIPIGRVLKLLKFIEEEDLKSALRTQELVRLGLNPEIALPVLSRVAKEKVSFDLALVDVINQLHSKNNGKQPAAVQHPLPAAAGGGAAASRLQTSEIRKLSPAELLKEGDNKLMEDKCADAEKLYLQAKEHAEGLFGQGNLETTAPLLKLANLYLVTDRFSEAESLYMQILQVKQNSFGEQHPAVAEALDNIADLYIARDEFDKARQFLHIAVMIREKSLPKEIDGYLETVKRLNVALQHKVEGEGKRVRLGELLTEAGLVGSAPLSQALQQSRNTGIPLGSVLQESGLVTGRDLRSVLNAQFVIQENRLPEQIAVMALKASFMKGVGFKELIVAAGLVPADHQDEASARLVLEQERLLALETEHGPEAAIVAGAVLELADKYAERNRVAEAEGLYRRAISILRKSPETVPAADDANHRLAQLYMAQERYSQAEPLLLETLQSRTASGDTSSKDAFVCLKDLARIAHLQDNLPIAANFLRSAVSVLVTLPHCIVSPEDMRWMIICLTDASMIPMAQAMLQHQVAQAEKNFGPGSVEAAQLQLEAGNFLFSHDNKVDAKTHFRKALLAYRHHLSAGDPLIANLADKLSQCAIEAG